MVITKLYGGLGNQMFQYAAGLAVARRLAAPLFVDTTWFDPRRHPPEAPPLRVYELDAFGISETIPLRARLRMNLRRPAVFAEAGFGYQPEIETLRGDVVLDGHWQSYRYFESVAGEVREAFRFPSPASATGRRLLERIAGANTVAVHVRRGDYVANPKLARKFGVLSPVYYGEAAARIDHRAGDPEFLVFSDEIDWCRRNIALDGGRTTFVEGTAGAHEDMLLMSRCRHHIVANSSFSWWGAWLGAEPDQVVVAPARWFNDPPVDTSDLIPDGWLRI